MRTCRKAQCIAHKKIPCRLPQGNVANDHRNAATNGPKAPYPLNARVPPHTAPRHCGNVPSPRGGWQWTLCGTHPLYLRAMGGGLALARCCTAPRLRGVQFYLRPLAAPGRYVLGLSMQSASSIAVLLESPRHIAQTP